MGEAQGWWPIPVPMEDWTARGSSQKAALHQGGVSAPVPLASGSPACLRHPAGVGVGQTRLRRAWATVGHRCWLVGKPHTF